MAEILIARKIFISYENDLMKYSGFLNVDNIIEDDQGIEIVTKNDFSIVINDHLEYDTEDECYHFTNGYIELVS